MPFRPSGRPPPCECKRYCGDLPEGLDDRLAVCKGLPRYIDYIAEHVARLDRYPAIPESGGDDD